MAHSRSLLFLPCLQVKQEMAVLIYAFHLAVVDAMRMTGQCGADDVPDGPTFAAYVEARSKECRLFGLIALVVVSAIQLTAQQDASWGGDAATLRALKACTRWLFLAGNATMYSTMASAEQWWQAQESELYAAVYDMFVMFKETAHNSGKGGACDWSLEACMLRIRAVFGKAWSVELETWLNVLVRACTRALCCPPPPRRVCASFFFCSRSQTTVITAGFFLFLCFPATRTHCPFSQSSA
jgi:hypothetical protein